MVLSLASAFIENAAAADPSGKSAEAVTQDGARKARHRLAPRIKKTYPPFAFVRALDSWYGVGPVVALAQELGWSYVVTFKEGRPPS